MHNKKNKKGRLSSVILLTALYNGKELLGLLISNDTNASTASYSGRPS